MKIKLSQWISKQKNLPSELQGRIIDQTEKAVKVEYITTVTVWLPKSQVQITEEKEEEK